MDGLKIPVALVFAMAVQLVALVWYISGLVHDLEHLKQTLSAQVLKAIVDSDSGKIDIINDDVKDKMIKQTIESAQNQQEGIGIQASEDMTDIVSDIIVNSNTETGSKMIEELNNSSTDTENDLSLQVISAISEKDTTKLNTLSENNKEQIEKLPSFIREKLKRITQPN